MFVTKEASSRAHCPIGAVPCEPSNQKREIAQSEVRDIMAKMVAVLLP